MRNRIHSTAVVSTVVTLLASLLGATGCSDPEGQELHLMPKPAEELTPESERLRKMQLVRGTQSFVRDCTMTNVQSLFADTAGELHVPVPPIEKKPTENDPTQCVFSVTYDAAPLDWARYLALFMTCPSLATSWSLWGK